MGALGSVRRAATRWSRTDARATFRLQERRRIAVCSDPIIGQLIEQAAAAAGGQNEERIAELDPPETAELDKSSGAARLAGSK